MVNMATKKRNYINPRTLHVVHGKLGYTPVEVMKVSEFLGLLGKDQQDRAGAHLF